MCLKLSLTIKPLWFNTQFKAPVTISCRPHLMQTIARESLDLISIFNDYIERGPKWEVNNSRVHFYHFPFQPELVWYSNLFMNLVPHCFSDHKPSMKAGQKFYFITSGQFSGFSICVWCGAVLKNNLDFHSCLTYHDIYNWHLQTLSSLHHCPLPNCNWINSTLKGYLDHTINKHSILIIFFV